MRRKLIEKLTKITEPIEASQLRRLLLDDDSNDAAVARAVLAAALAASRKAGVTDPQQIYRDICEAAPAQLAAMIASRLTQSFTHTQIVRAQDMLKDELTSKAGRPATGSPELRQVQVAAAQARRRQKLANQEGRKQINEWISTEAAELLTKIQEIHSCKSRAEALEKVLQPDVLAALLASSATT